MNNESGGLLSFTDKRWWKFSVFIVNFGSGLAMLILLFTSNNSPCLVNYSYRQDMAINVVGNPYYSSTHIWREGPASKLEQQYYGARNFRQMASDIFMFPNIIRDEYEEAAFIPVRESKSVIAGADEIILPSNVHEDYYFYWDHEMQSVYVRKLDNSSAEIARGVMSQVSGNWRPGMQVPNLFRCAKKLYGSSREDTIKGLEVMVNSSHLRGACLLSGQQHTVDITSNYKNSMVLFSSVNPIFMVMLVNWICASFALFHLGTQKLWFKKAQPYVSTGVLLVSTVWNMAVLLMLAIPAGRENGRIPLNNAIVGGFFLLATIAVQWRIGSSILHDEEAEEIADHVLRDAANQAGNDESTNQDDETPNPIGGEEDRSGSARVTRLKDAPPPKAPSGASSYASVKGSKLECTPSSFLSAAAYGHGGPFDVAMPSGPRMRANARNPYRNGDNSRRRLVPPMGHPFQNRPAFYHMIRTGDTFAFENFMDKVTVRRQLLSNACAHMSHS